MRKAILMMMLVVLSSSAAAEWVSIGTTNDGNGTGIYADPSTIRRAGNKVKMWILFDHKTARNDAASGKTYMSTKYQDEYDCKEEQTRSLFSADFSGNMGEGAVVYSGSGSGKWEPFPPGSVFEGLWKIACGKR